MTTDYMLVEFNPNRACRNAPAARVYIYEDGQMVDWLWMTPDDARKNIAEFGDHPAFRAVIEAYETPTVRFDAPTTDLP